MFVLENLWVKIFQIHWTLFEEEFKTLQIYLHWTWYNNVIYEWDLIALGEPNQNCRGEKDVNSMMPTSSRVEWVA